MKVKVKRLPGNEDVSIPKYQTLGSAACDVHAAVVEPMIIRPGERKLVPTGLSFEFDKGYVMHLTPRSGLALKKGIILTNTPAIIDSDFRGELRIIVMNLGEEDFIIERNDRIAQMNFKKVEQAEFVEVDELMKTKRGSGCFGSTGK